MESPDYDILPNVFKPNSGATTTTVTILSSELSVQEYNQIEAWQSGHQNWSDVVSDLDRRLKELKLKYSFSNSAIHNSIKAKEMLLESAAVTAPFPASWVLKATELKLKYLRKVVEKQLTNSFNNASNKLAKKMISSLMDERGRTYDSLFPSGNPDTARQNIMAARDLLNTELPELDPKIKATVLNAMVESLNSLYEQGYDGNDLGEIPEGEIEDDAKNIENCANSLEEYSKKEKEKMEVQAKAIDDISSSLNDVFNNYENTEASEERIKSNIEKILSYTSIAPDVLDAAVALGLDQRTAAEIGRGIRVFESAMGVYLNSLGPDYLGVIQSTSQLISGIFGGGKDPAQQRHEEIMNALTVLAMQNEAILENQRMILKNQELIIRGIFALNQNQTVIVEQNRKIMNEVLINRDYLVSLTSGALNVYKQVVLDRDGTISRDRVKSNQLGYKDLKILFSHYGGVIYKALEQLEVLFLSDHGSHIIFKSKSYVNEPIIEVETTTNGTAIFKLAEDQDVIPIEHIELLLTTTLKKFSQGNLAERLRSEYATYDLLFFRENQLDSEAERSNSLTVSNELLNANLVSEMSEIAINSHYLFQFISGRDSSYGFKEKQEILSEERCNPRGKYLLENVLKILNTTIAQRCLLSPAFYAYEVMGDILNNNVSGLTLVKWKLATDNKPEKLFSWFIAYIACSKGDYSWLKEYFNKSYRSNDILRELSEFWYYRGYSDVDYDWDRGAGSGGVYDYINMTNDYIEELRNEKILTFKKALDDIGVNSKILDTLNLSITNFIPEFYENHLHPNPYRNVPNEMLDIKWEVNMSAFVSADHKPEVDLLLRVHNILPDSIGLEKHESNTSPYKIGIQFDLPILTEDKEPFNYLCNSIYSMNYPIGIEDIIVDIGDRANADTPEINSDFLTHTRLYDMKSDPILERLVYLKNLLIAELTEYSSSENLKQVWNAIAIESSR